MQTPRRSARKRTGPSPKYSAKRPYTRRPVPRRLNFTPQPVSVVRNVNIPAKASRIGFPPGSSTDFKRITVNKWTAATSSMSAKQLISEELTLIPRKTANEINARERDMINCLGFTLRISLTSNSGGNSSAFRMAVVSPIDSNAMSVVDFFRGYDGNRATAFTSNTDASQLLFNPINRDKYVVLWEKKILLGPGADNIAAGSERTFSRTSDGFSTFETYVKLNRQLRWSDADADTCTDKVFLVCWFDFPNGEASAAPPGATVNYRRFALTHWKDP